MDIVQNINKAIQGTRYTLTELERICEFPKSSMRKWSENIPSINKVAKVADVLNVSLDYLYYGEEKHHRNDDGAKEYVGYTDSFVAFIDILGFKNYILNNNFTFAKDLFNDIRNFANQLLKSHNDVFTKEMLSTVTLNIISDSIVISVPKTTKYSLEMLLLAINTIVFNVLREYGLICRGGIAEGYFHSDNEIAFGPALVAAYNLENSVAVYPRIVFTREVYDSYYKICDKDDIKNLSDIMVLDADEELFIADYIGFAIGRIACDVIEGRVYRRYAEALFKHISNIIEDVLACNTDRKIREKYIYFRDYYNNCLKTIKEAYTLPFNADFIFGRDTGNNIVENQENKLIAAARSTDDSIPTKPNIDNLDDFPTMDEE